MSVALSQGLKGEKDIQLAAISSIQFKNAGRLTSGYIQFAFMGGQESKAGLLLAAADENTVMFRRSQQPAFEALREAVQLRLAPSENTGGSVADEIEKLAALRERGILTEDEFQAKKAQMLGL